MAHNAAIDALAKSAQKALSRPTGGSRISDRSSRRHARQSNRPRKRAAGGVVSLLRSLPEEYRLPLTLRYIAGPIMTALHTTGADQRLIAWLAASGAQIIARPASQ